MTATPSFQPTPEQLAMAGSHTADELAGFLAEIAEEDAQLALGDPPPPASVEQPGPGAAVAGGEAAGQGALLAGKFRSPEELERGYLELQRKLGERQPPPAPAAPAPLTREQAVSGYGEAVVNAAETQGIDLGQWDQLVRQGGDTAPLREKLAGALGISSAVIERYESAFRPPAAAPPAVAPSAAPEPAGGLSDQDVASIMAEAGGEAGFAAISQWARASLTPGQLNDYNGAVDSGSPAAARAAVRWLVSARAAAPREPSLVLGSAAPGADVFETEQQALEALNAKTADGKIRYRTDPKYRAAVEAKLARSTVFV